MKTYKIKIELVEAQAVAAAARAAKAVGGVGAAADKAMKDAQKALDRLAADEQRAMDRMVKAADKAADQKAKAAQKAADRERAAYESLVNAELAGSDRALKGREADADRAAQAAKRGADKAADAQARAAQRAQKAHEAAFARSRDSALDFAKGVGTATLALAGIGSASAVINAAADAFLKAKDMAYDAAKMVQDYRKALLELAALKGLTGKGGTTQGLAETLGLRQKTLQSRTDAVGFEAAVRSVGEASVDTADTKRLISEDEFKKAIELGGAFQAAEGGSAQTHGQLVGMIPQLAGKRMTGEQVLQKEKQLYDIFKPGGAEFSSMVSQFMGLSPLIASGLITDTRAAALESAFSVTATDKGKAGTMVEQLTRGTVGGLGRMRGHGVEGSEKQGKYLTRIGATNQMDPIEIAELISKDFERQEGAEVAAGRKFNAMDYLKHHGYGNLEEIQALMQFHGLKKSGTFDRTFMKLANRMPSADEAKAFAADFQAADPRAQGNRAELADDAATVAVGAGKEEYLENLRRTAFARLKARGEAKGAYEDYRDSYVWGGRQRVDAEAEAMLKGEAKRRGVRGSADWADRFTGVDILRGTDDQQLWEHAQQVGKAGGDPLPGIDQLIGIAQRQLDSQQRLEAAIRDSLKLKKPIPQAQPRAGAAHP